MLKKRGLQRIAAWNTRLATSPTPAPVDITMQDVRLVAGEGKLSPQTVLDAVNVVLRQRAGAPVAMQEGEVERVARALFEHEWSPKPCDDGAFNRDFDYWSASARAAIAALRASSPVGEGWKLVPVQAMPEMIAAWWRQKNCGSQDISVRFGEGDDFSDYAAYRAMLAAAPVPPAGQREG